ncbi:hypothetical protein G8C92_06500 [Paenibacillus donghaensis]|uniref:rolling circle replication-associated protein n=1 Tax=Paenibacillus donghaensis TaxID=414771 RepID=UPI001884767B|nr:hypothetical protein [Paenibacillus donghaensis]MBE9913680.1 hypothetical protein [Paenibacillus donghaensis]
MANHKFYRKKAIISGNQVELLEHEFPVVFGFTGKQGGRKAGTSGSSQRSAEYRKRATNKSKADLIRLVNTNFTSAGMGRTKDSYKFITLTFRDGSIPDLTDVKRAYTEFKKYARKLREASRKQGREFKYIAVVEFQDENNRGAVHFHVIADIPVIPVTREIAEEWKRQGKLPHDYKVKINHYDIWGHGSVTVKAIRESNQKQETSTVIETADIGEYVAGYMVKDFGDPRLQGNKAYSPSQGLKKPRVVHDYEAEQAVEGLGKENVVREGSYPDTYHNTTVKYVKFNKRKK